MACSGHTNTAGSQPCSSNVTTIWTDLLLSNNILVKQQHINELRLKINNERIRRGLPAINWGLVNITNVVKVDDVQQLRDSINEMENKTCLCDCNNLTCTTHTASCTCNCNYI